MAVQAELVKVRDAIAGLCGRDSVDAFEEEDFQLLWKNKYRTLDVLSAAKRQSLEKINLSYGLIDLIEKAQERRGAAAEARAVVQQQGAEETAGGQARGGAQDVFEPVASNRAIAEQLLGAELCDWPEERTDGPVDELGRFLVSPPPSKLPVLAWHHRVVIATDPCFEQYVRVAGSCPLVTKISSALCELEVQPGDLESRVTQWVVGYMLLLEHLSVALDHADRLTVRVGIDTSEKNVSDPIVSSSGTRSRRPDVVLTGARLTLLVGEHKRSRSLGDAWDRLKEYLGNGFPVLFYGPAPYLLCFAAAGSEIQFGTVSQDGKVTCIGQPLNASLLSDRLKICNAVINSYRIFKLLVKQAPPEEHRVELYKRIERSHNTSVVVTGKTAIKTVNRAETFFKEFGNNVAVLKAVYARAQECPELVSGQVEGSRKRSRPGDSGQWQSIKITMTRVGYRRPPPLSELDMKRVVSVGLKAIAHLHEAEPPMCHCDLRVDNFLWDPSCFLTDLEFSHFEPWQYSRETLLADWEEGTLDDQGRYTKDSDVYQVGVMLQKYTEALSSEGLDFVSILKSKKVSAREALQHPYLLAP